MIRLLPLLLLAAAGQGTVVHVTRSRAYLDRGSVHGLAQGMDLELRRRGRPVGRCRIDQVSDHHASCDGAAARPGDTFAHAAPAPPPAPARPAESLPPAEVERRAAAVHAAPGPQVVDRAAPRAPGLAAGPIEATFGHASFTSFEAADGSFHEERLGVSLHGLPVAGPLSFSGDVTAVGYLARPDDPAYRPDARSFLLVHQAELTTRGSALPAVLSFGRVWPWYTPGVYLVDGAQAGVLAANGALELGAYGGGLPAPDTLEPAFDAWTAGLYWMGQRSGPRSWIRHTGRAGAVNVPGLGTRAELEVAAVAVPVRSLDVAASLRIHGGGDLDAPAIAAASIEGGVRPIPTVRISAGFRELDADAAALDFARRTSGRAVAATTRHADVAAAWDVTPWITVAGRAGTGVDATSGWSHRWVGPELVFPRLAGGGPLSLGYQEELGDWRGRAAWTQAVLPASEAVRLVGRLSYSEDDFEDLVSREIGLLLGGELQVAEKLHLTASVLARPALPPLGAEDAAVPVGVLGDLGLRGRF